MVKPFTTYFAFPYTSNNYILGLVMDSWVGFFDCYFANVEHIPKPEKKLSPLFVLYGKDISFFENSILLDDAPFEGMLESNQEQVVVYFDQEQQEFKAKTDVAVRKASEKESLAYVDIIASQYATLTDIKLRIVEMSMGFIPSFQYKVERVYENFFNAYRDSIKTLNKFLNVKERKKEFDKIFKEQILPFANQYGFERHTKTSHRLVKQLENGLSIFILFEHYNFGSGSYGVNIIYFDKDIGTFEEDDYLATLAPRFPYSSNLMIASQNAAVLNFEIAYWMRIMELYLFPFMEKNSTYQDILNTINNKEIIDKKRTALGIDPLARDASYYFKLSKEKYLELIKEKTNNYQ